MRVFKELSFVGDKVAFDEFKRISPSLERGDWHYSRSDRMKDYIAFDYLGNVVNQAEVSIYCGPETWKDRKIRVGNIVPLKKNQLSIEEYNAVLDLFYDEIIQPNQTKFKGLTVVGPESDLFDPLKYISEEALTKLELFCNSANKTTGSSYPSDEARWFDFICQTVNDGRTFDCDTLSRFLMDEDYWGKKGKGFIGAMGHFAWDEEHASELSTEYDNYVRFLQFYKKNNK